MANKTSQDAHERIILAQVGCMDGATEYYLLALRVKLLGWVALVDEELSRCYVDEDMLVYAPNCCHEESVTTVDGHGTYCRACGETLS